MRILFVTGVLGGGGAERVIVTLADTLSVRPELDIGLLTLMQRKDTYPVGPQVESLELAACSSNVQMLLRLRKKIADYRPDVIVSFICAVNIIVLLATIGMKANVIVSERNDPSKVAKSLLRRFLRMVLYPRATLLVCQTEQCKAFFSKSMQKKTVVLLNPLKPGLPAPYEGVREKRIVNFCRLQPAKNLKLLIDAFELFSSRVPDYTLEIYGDGSQRDILLQYIRQKRMGTKVQLYPASPRIHEKVRKAAMFVSSSDYEGMSNSMLEALAIGLPVICTDCPIGGAAAVIEDGTNGLLVPPGDSRRLADAMERIALCRIDPGMLSHNAGKIRERLNADRIAEQWLQHLITKERGSHDAL